MHQGPPEILNDQTHCVIRKAPVCSRGEVVPRARETTAQRAVASRVVLCLSRIHLFSQMPCPEVGNGAMKDAGLLSHWKSKPWALPCEVHELLSTLILPGSGADRSFTSGKVCRKTVSEVLLKFHVVYR